jgi:hypothetical protein
MIYLCIYEISSKHVQSFNLGPWDSQLTGLETIGSGKMFWKAKGCTNLLLV